MDFCIRNCSGSCKNTGFTRVEDITLEQGYIPEYFVVKLKKKGIIEDIKRCGYCGVIYQNNFIIGEGKLNSENMKWFV